MRKVIVWVFITLLLAGGLFSYPRKVLWEHFTNTACSPCATYNPIVDGMIESYGDDILPIKYHPWWPSNTDPFYVYNIEHNTQRTQFYGVGAVPDCICDGILEPSPGSLPAMQNAVNQRLAADSPIQIVLNKEERGLYVEIRATITADNNGLQGNNYRLFFVATETNFEYDVAPGSNGETEFKDCMRTFHPNTNGIEIEVAPNDTEVFTEQCPVDELWVSANTRYIVFVQDITSQEIIQAEATGYLIDVLPKFSVNNVMGGDVEGESDNDGMPNPGDQVTVTVELLNISAINGNDVYGVLSCDDERVEVITANAQFGNIPGNFAGTNSDPFVIAIDEDAESFLAECNLEIHANENDEIPYVTNRTVFVEINFNQGNWDFDEDGTFKVTPSLVTLSSGADPSIFVTEQDAGVIYGLDYTGNDLPGFPFEQGPAYQGACAFADFDGDGTDEIVVATQALGIIYVLNSDGSVMYSHQTGSVILTDPVVADFDADGSYEVIFTTIANQVYVVNPEDGTNVAPFPIISPNANFCSPSVGYIDDDNMLDIVFATTGKKITAISNNGEEIFSYGDAETGQFKGDAVLVDLDGDQKSEIVTGADNNTFYIIDNDGSELLTVDIDEKFEASFAVADIDDDGNYEFAASDKMGALYLIDMDGVVDGFPVELDSRVDKTPLIADIDNDGVGEIIAVTYLGTIYIIEADGSQSANSPITVGVLVETAPAIGDIDGDNDMEIILASSSDIRIIDYKKPMGDILYGYYRAGLHRTGNVDLEVMAVQNDQRLAQGKVVRPMLTNYPNPFNPATVINYSLPEQYKSATLDIYNLKGRLIKSFDLESSFGKVNWDGTNASSLPVSSGIYFYSISAEGKTLQSSKMILMK